MSREVDNEFRQRTFRLLEAFVYDYLRKSGCIETARTYFEEAQLDDWPPPWLEQLITSSISPITIPTIPPSVTTTQHSREESLDDSEQACTHEFTNELGGGSFDENVHTDGNSDGASNVDSIPDLKIQLVQVKEEENLKIKTENINDSVLPPEFTHEAIINSHMSKSDYLQYAERSPSIISATTTTELPDLLLPLEGQDDFLQDWWYIVWENYKTMFERQTGIVLSTDY
ncbi:6709_t:CDS:1 [Dentiscutata heterogama]|uniref:6709_t:CDS:1 n=1 Tax=Dentiscutata heterogama TaxID=1316150 RepID=A0ACA9LF33_9GLOM|nr:6709_t:CDS:1 [Dentiscutata heterogama]